MDGLTGLFGGETSRRAGSRATLLLALFVVALFISSSASLPTAIPDAGAAKAKKKTTLNRMFNSRYCEIFGVSSLPNGTYSVQIFNTVGLNKCPEAQWAALDFQAIAASEGWFAAAPNGPRHWLMDTIVGARPTNPRTFGGIRMRQVATLTTSVLQPPPFTEFEIRRRTTWVFNKGRTIHSLTDPAGNRYVMQAYTRTVDPTLDPNTLKNLGSNQAAAIPEGWTFKSTRLKRPLRLEAKGTATILRDGVRSVYQLVK